MQLSPSSMHVESDVAHSPVLGSQTRTPQQSPSLVQSAPRSAHPQVALTHSSEQQSDAPSQGDPSVLHTLAQVALSGSHRSVPQQSALLWQGSPAPRQSHVLLVGSHRSAPQQSALLAQGLPLSAHAHVSLFGSHNSAPQQSALVPHPWPASAQPHVWFTHCSVQQSEALWQPSPSSRHAPPSAPPSAFVPVPQVNVVWSQRSAPQQSKSVTQSLPWPAQAGVHVPSWQKLEQQSPLVTHPSPSDAHVPPASFPPPAPPESCPPPPGLPPASTLPASRPVPPPPPVPVPDPHLPAVHASEQQLLKLWQLSPFCAHMAEPEPHVPPVQVWLQHCDALPHDVPSASHEGVGALQKPPVQVVLQHCMALWHAVPLASHAAPATHAPALQLWLQHALLDVQFAPCAPQLGSAQAPLVHVLLQHWLALVQAPPDASQEAAAQMPLVHAFVQQSLACAQA